MVTTDFLTLGQEYRYESKEDTIPLNLKITLQLSNVDKDESSCKPC